MGCGCNSSKASTGSGWKYCSPTNHCTTYPSEVEAKAAKKRAGNVGTVKAA